MSLFQEVFTNVVVSLLGDLSNSFIAKIWNDSENFNTLQETLQKNLKELQETLKRIHENRSCLSYTQIPSDWLDELVWCRYEIEDTIDSINLAISKQTLTTRMLQSNLERIRALQSKLDGVGTKLSNRQTNNDQASIGLCRASLPPALTLPRMEDKEAIIEELKSHEFGVSILGIGGTGKTKLAEAILEDVSIKEHFSCILSPPPSRKFNLRSMLECLNGTIPCERRRVLIQLDGLQSVTPEDWHHFQSQCQQKFNPASKVLITTQNPRVVDVTGSRKYCLQTLSDQDCFSLIYSRAEANKNLCEDDIQAIKHNEKELVEKCQGLPLLANHIGLLLSAEAPGKRDKIIRGITACSMWKQSELEKVLVNLTPVSMLAQNPHLQRCVAYCSLFPPDHDFKRDSLVQLWMMEGFTQAPSTTEDAGFLEQIASQCFDDLLSHSIFQALELLSDEEPTYKMHQLLYDLAQNVASKAFCRIHVGNTNFSLSTYTRHLSLSCENIEKHEKIILPVLSDIATCHGLRTFLLLHRAGEKISQNPTFFEKLECLRVLDLSHANLTKLSNISKLKHLRYLDLSHTPIKRLPSLSKNPTLLVLKLNECDLLQCLPNDLSKLTNLISLQVNTKSLGAMPQFIGKLSKLQSLNVFIVGNDEGYEIAELKNMNDLREALCITKLENVKTKLKAQEAMLHNKKRLQRLELHWSSLGSNDSAKEVLEGLLPPKNMKELTISKYNGFEFPQWIGKPEVCGMLRTIHLSHCEACTVLPSLGQLQMLKTLHLEAMNGLTQFFGEGFLSLESLKLCDLPNLTEWTVLTAGDMPRLHELQIVDCQRLAKLPPMEHLPSLVRLEIHECAQLEELPTLPVSVQSIIITDSDILRQRCQVGNPDWHKIKGINVVIDSERVDTGEQHRPAPAEAVNVVIDSERVDTGLQHGPAPAEGINVGIDSERMDTGLQHEPAPAEGINVGIDSERVDTSEQHGPAPAEVVVHQSNYMQIEGSPIVNDTDSRDQLAEHRPHSLSEMDISEDLHQLESTGQLPIEMDATECYMQVSEQQLAASLRVNIDQQKDTLLQIKIPHSAAKRRRRSKA